MLYFDARLARAYPTVEVRVADVCLRADDAVLLAGLTRALVETAARSWRDGETAPDVRTEVLRLATWRASRSGTSASLVHPLRGTPQPAHLVVDAFVDHVRDALRDAGDHDAVAEMLATLRERGSGAARQREVFGRAGRLSDVVLDAADLTGRCQVGDGRAPLGSAPLGSAPWRATSTCTPSTRNHGRSPRPCRSSATAA